MRPPAASIVMCHASLRETSATTWRNAVTRMIPAGTLDSADVNSSRRPASSKTRIAAVASEPSTVSSTRWRRPKATRPAGRPSGASGWLAAARAIARRALAPALVQQLRVTFRGGGAASILAIALVGVALDLALLAGLGVAGRNAIHRFLPGRVPAAGGLPPGAVLLLGHATFLAAPKGLTTRGRRERDTRLWELPR